MSENKTFLWGKSLSDKFPFLAAITAIGYLMTYFHQAGIASYYGYPNDFIFFDINTLLKSLAFLYMLFAVVILPISMLGFFKYKKSIYALTYISIFITYISVFELRNPFTFFSKNTAISSLTMLAFFIIPLGCLNSIFGVLERKDSRFSKFILICLSALIIGVFPDLLGKISAFNTMTHYQLKGNETFILLSSSGGKMVLGSCIDGEKKFMLSDASPNITLIPIKSKDENKKIRDCFFNNPAKAFTL